MVNVKKRISVLVLSLFAVIILASLVSAYLSFDPYSIENFVQNIINGMTSVASPVLTSVFGGYQSADFLFAKLLVFILLFVVVKVAVKATPRLGDNRAVANIIALIVAILAIRYMNETEFFKGILLPYGVLGVALTTLLPFMIYFFFVHQSMASGSGRRLAFIFFLIVFVIMWITRYGELTDVNNYIYLATLVLCVCALLFDKSIKAYFKKGEIEEAQEMVNANQIAKAINSYNEVAQAYASTGGTNKTLERLLEKKAKHLKKLGVKMNE